MLGLSHKGHLGVGADADITIYTPGADKRAMFELPRYVLKAGEIVVEQGEIRQEVYGKTVHVAPDYDEGRLPDIKKWFESYYTVQFANYPVDAGQQFENGVAVACRP
jgi:formylmethanofuran dehydrogenase subunit A